MLKKLLSITRDQDAGMRLGVTYRGLAGNIILGLYRDNGKENGNYYIIVGYILGWGEYIV